MRVELGRMLGGVWDYEKVKCSRILGRATQSEASDDL